MTPVALFELVLLLLAAIVVLELLARRLHLPPAAAFVLGGGALALMPGTPELRLDPDLVLVLFLPPLLTASAHFTAWRDFRANLRIILQLAVGAVVFTTLVVGAVAHLVAPGLPWAACFALGAIVSPPDAVAAKAVLAGLRLPRRIVVLLEGESLVNDATGIVLFRMAVAAAVTGTFSLVDATGSFAVLAVGGVLTGLAFGVVGVLALARLRDPHLAMLFTLLMSWASYIGADALGVSGVLSAVAVGLLIGWRQHTLLSAQLRTELTAVWGVVVYVLEALVFILIGLSLRGVLDRLGQVPGGVGAVVLPGAAVLLAVVVSRFAWIIPATYVPRLLLPGLRRRDPIPPFSVPVVMSWAGMRGVVSLAVALGLPDGFPGRDFILITTFAVILLTVLVQGSTLGPLIRWLRLDRFVLHGRETMTEAAARARMSAVQLAAVQARAMLPDGTARHPRLLEQYSYRARASARFSEAAGALNVDRTEHFEIVLAALDAGRAELLRLHREGQIHDQVLHALEQELDLEELSARRHLTGA